MHPRDKKFLKYLEFLLFYYQNKNKNLKKAFKKKPVSSYKYTFEIVFSFNLLKVTITQPAFSIVVGDRLSPIEVVDPLLSALITTKALDFGLWAFFVILTATRRLLIDSKDLLQIAFGRPHKTKSYGSDDQVALIFWVLIKNPSNVRYISLSLINNESSVLTVLSAI